MNTKQDLLENFKESYKLEEGNRKHKQALYKLDKNETPTLDKSVDNVIEYLCDLFLSPMNPSKFWDKIKPHEHEFNHCGIYYLDGAEDFYYVYYTYMFHKGYLDSADYNLNMSGVRALHKSMAQNSFVDSDFGRITGPTFPIIPDSMFANINTREILATTSRGAMIIMDAFVPADGERTYHTADIYDDTECRNLITNFVNNNFVGEESNVAEEDFYKAAYDITFN